MRYYYHITQEVWPIRITLEPRDSGINRGPLEPVLARICVAPTIAQCIVALGNILDFSPIQVYRTARMIPEYDVIEAYDVPDACITDEAWLTKPTEFELFRIIENHNYYNAPSAGSHNYELLLQQDMYYHRIKDDEVLKC